MKRRLRIPGLILPIPSLVVLVVLGACTPDRSDGERVNLMTTTTVEDSGLLEVLLEAYHAAGGPYRVSAVATASGAALEIGRRGDADLLITHDPTGERRFMAAGHGAAQGALMRSEFIIAGPPTDPAGVRGSTDLAAGFDKIAAADATFVSRADDSGTHKKEIELWARSGRPAPGYRPGSYVETGSGMAETLRVADHRAGYVLSDFGTFRHLATRLKLELLAQGAPPEVNPYQYTLPVRARNPEGARHVIDWLTGPGQRVIADYGVARLGEPLYRPATAVEGAAIPSPPVR